MVAVRAVLNTLHDIANDGQQWSMLTQMEMRKAEDRLTEVRGWLNQAQGQLQNTQAALSDREAACRHLKMQLKDTHGKLDAVRGCHDATRYTDMCLRT